MKFKALIFDINGTVSDILTTESKDEIYFYVANFLSYQGIKISGEQLCDEFWEINKRQRRESKEEFPEFSVIGIFDEIINRYATNFTESLPKDKLKWLPEYTAQAFRAATLLQLKLYPYVREVLDELKSEYKLAALSDGQSIWAVPELASVGLLDYFEPIIVSSDFGYRKPDNRMYSMVCEKLEIKPADAVMIGNDQYRDVWGGKMFGMETIFFKSNQGDQRMREIEPDYIIYKFADLINAINFLEEKLSKH